MDIIETLKKNITETAQFAAEKAKITKDILVTREQIRTKKKEIRTLTYKIGETYLELHAEDAEDAFADYIRDIKEAEGTVEAKEQELDDLKEQFKAAAEVVDEDIDAEMAEFFEEEDDDAEEAPEEKAVPVEEAEEAAPAEDVAEEAAPAEEAAEAAPAEEVAEEAAPAEEVAEEAVPAEETVEE